MLILVVNAGSSSLKYQLINMEDESVLAKGNCDRIGIDGHVSHKTADGRTVDADCNFPTHTEAFEKLVEVLTTGDDSWPDPRLACSPARPLPTTPSGRSLLALAEGHLTFLDPFLPEARRTQESTSEKLVSPGALPLKQRNEAMNSSP